MNIPEIPSDIKTTIIPQFHISSLWIFGSAIREDYSEESDIDLIVEF